MGLFWQKSGRPLDGEEVDTSLKATPGRLRAEIEKDTEPLETRTQVVRALTTAVSHAASRTSTLIGEGVGIYKRNSYTGFARQPYSGPETGNLE